MIVHQAVAHAVGERLAEIISVADVRRRRTKPHNVMGCAAHRMRVRREVAPSQTRSIAATGGPCLLLLACGPSSAITS